jgi:hypothetical protein
LPPGFGVRQPSGAIDVSKAAEDRRNPGRYRAHDRPFRFMVTIPEK